MNADKKRICSICVYLCLSAVSLSSVGCGKPNRANIDLRKRIFELEAQVADLQRQREGDAATIRAYESQRPTVSSLPQERLDQLFTAHGLKIGRLTGGADTDPTRPGDESVQVHVVPTDQRGDLLKAAGTFTIDAFDLSLPQDNRVGHWEFDVAESAKNWIGNMLTYGYSFTRPWERPPRGQKVTVRVTFRDALTGREFTEQTEVTVRPPGASTPATAPSTSPAAAR